MTYLVLGHSIQGLVAGALLARAGAQVTIVDFPETDLDSVSHLPVAFPDYLIDQLDLKAHGFEDPAPVANPFEALPFYDGLQKLTEMFLTLDDYRPPYNEKAWRDTWSTLEIGRILSGYPDDIQDLFAKSATLSLVDLLNATDLDDTAKAKIIAHVVLGSATDPSAAGSAAAILPAMAVFQRKNVILIQGALRHLIRALKQAAMAQGANVLLEEKIRKFVTSDEAIECVILDNEEELKADHYIVDHDLVDLFASYLPDISVPLAFQNRIAPDKNVQFAAHVTVEKSGTDKIKQGVLAAKISDITTAYADMKNGGGSQTPLLSLMNGQDGQIDIIAQYFEPEVMADNQDAILEAVKKALFVTIPALDGQVTSTTCRIVSSHFGQFTIAGGMPLLQLFKIFSGHHALAYDMPVTNMIVAGYGNKAAAHAHIFGGGERVATLYQSD